MSTTDTDEAAIQEALRSDVPFLVVPDDTGRRRICCLRGDGPLPVDPADGVAVLEVIDAARTSAAERVVVAV